MKKKTKTYTQKEYDACKTEWFQRGIKEGQQQLKRKFYELFDLDSCADIDESNHSYDEDYEYQDEDE